MNYATYPMKNRRITQNYSGSTSHKPHTTGDFKDYPIDEGGKDTGKEAVYCPCDEIEIKRVYGVGNSGVNTVFWESTSKVNFADGTSNYLCGLYTHTVDSDLKNVKVGKKFKRNEVVCKEGTDGNVGMHIHMSFGKGKLQGNGWAKNSNGKYVLNCTGGAFKPEQILYTDPKFTNVISDGGLKFKTLPKEEPKPVATPKAESKYYNKYTGKSTSIVDALDSLKIDSSYAHRKAIAKVNGVASYIGSPSQNTKLLTLLKQGKLVKA